jgi:hypothetical protein
MSEPSLVVLRRVQNPPGTRHCYDLPNPMKKVLLFSRQGTSTPPVISRHSHMVGYVVGRLSSILPTGRQHTQIMYNVWCRLIGYYFYLYLVRERRTFLPQTASTTQRLTLQLDRRRTKKSRCGGPRNTTAPMSVSESNQTALAWLWKRNTCDIFLSKGRASLLEVRTYRGHIYINLATFYFWSLGQEWPFGDFAICSEINVVVIWSCSVSIIQMWWRRSSWCSML